MMEFQKILKPRGKVVIICDYREREIISCLKNLGALINEQALEIGDFICSERVGIERKSYDDFVNSVINGRIFEQAKSLKCFKKPLIIIEGYSDRKINENALKAAIASLLIDFDLPVLRTRNQEDTARLIYWIAMKEQMEKKMEVGIKRGKKPKGIKELQEFVICSFPGISKVLGKRLLEKFGSLEKIFNASERELTKVKGISKSLAKKIREILSSSYG